MKINKLQILDKSFNLIHSNADLQDDVLGITDTKELNSKNILFVKNKQFMKEIEEKKFFEKNIGLILEKKYFETLNQEKVVELKKDTYFLATVSDVNLAMSFMSKSFYDEKIGQTNDFVDGRIMGTASIHSMTLISQNVFIGENVKIHQNVKIHPGCVVMSGVEIDEDTEIFPNVTIYRNVKIGKNVRIHSGSVIGADGFGYNFYQGEHLKVWHMGGVDIGDNVEIGANSCVDSGTFSPTKIGAGTKIDNQVQVGHNSQIGKGVILCGSVGLAGSCTLHDYVVVGGKAAISNGVEVGMAAQVAGMAGVTSDVKTKETVAGFPARDMKEWLRGVAMLRKISLRDNKEK